MRIISWSAYCACCSLSSPLLGRLLIRSISRFLPSLAVQSLAYVAWLLARGLVADIRIGVNTLVD
jgi:hypothetical protein